MAGLDRVSHLLDTLQMVNLAQYFGPPRHIAPQMVDYSYDPENIMVPRFTEVQGSASDFNRHDVARDGPKADQVALIFKSRVVEKLTLLKLSNILSLHMKSAVTREDFNGNPEQLREILRSEYCGQPQACQLFSKEAKRYVTSTKVTQASAARRKCEARFVCPISGCTNKFTRRHNLNSKHVSPFTVS